MGRDGLWGIYLNLSWEIQFSHEQDQVKPLRPSHIMVEFLCELRKKNECEQNIILWSGRMGGKYKVPSSPPPPKKKN